VSNGNALAIIEQAKGKGALIFVDTQHLESDVALYKTEVTELNFGPSDFHHFGGKYMLNKAGVDRIGEACGIQFVQAACRVTTETQKDDLCGEHIIYRAEAQGQKRMTDGSWRTSTVDEYEFDPVLRAMDDKKVESLRDLDPRKLTEVNRRTIEYKKTARQRAATGARSRVIRQLTGMPIAFSEADAKKPMVFSRVVQNTDYILKTPEGRTLATIQALGMDAAALWGRKNGLPEAEGSEREIRDVTPEPDDAPPDGSGDSLAAQAASGDDDFPEDPAEQGETEFMRLSLEIEQLMESHRETLDKTISTGKNPYEMAQAELANPNATEESRRSMCRRLRTFLEKRGVDV